GPASAGAGGTGSRQGMHFRNVQGWDDSDHVFQKGDPYYTCPSRELATYVSVLVGLLAIQETLTGEMPNISDTTGEPEFTGETKTMVDGLREQARVRTFDQAAAICTFGS